MKLNLIRATVEDAELIWKMQIEAFADLLKEYQDMDTSPGNEPIEKVIRRLEQPYTYYYLLELDGEIVGAIRVVDKKDNQKNKRISPIFVLPQYRNKGIAQKAIFEVEKIHGDNNWELDTILQEKSNCYLYEKMGYKATGKTEVINDKLTLVFYEKKKILFGTGNQAKLSVMKNRLEKIGIELISLNDLRAEGKHIPEVLENGNTPLENARLKALAYYEAFHMPVFSCDSGLYFDNVPDEVQPGVHVRNVNGKCLSDEEMIEYYAGIVRQYGNLIARYRNAICFVKDENHIYEAMDSSMDSERFILTDKPHSAIRKKGFPLDSMSIDMKTNKYYYDLSADDLEQFAVEDGVLLFFKKVLRDSTQR